MENKDLKAEEKTEHREPDHAGRDNFEFSYSAKDMEEVRRLRERYSTGGTESVTPLDKMRALDAIPTKRATVIAVIVGILGTLIMGGGMSLIMSDFGAMLGNYAMLVGAVLGLFGITLVALAYPMYNWLLQYFRRKIAPEILKLSEEAL